MDIYGRSDWKVVQKGFSVIVWFINCIDNTALFGVV